MNNHRPPRSSRQGGSQAARGTHQEKAANGVMAVAQRIRKLREGKGLSQGDIERATGMLRGYISRVENSHTVPSVETLERFAMALDVPLYQLFPDQDESAGEQTALTAEDQSPEAQFLRRIKGCLRSLRDSDRDLVLELAKRLVDH